MESILEFFYALIAFLVIFSAIALIWAVVMIIAQWILFKKAGVSGWIVLIPYYNSYKLIEIATNNNRLGWIYVSLSVASTIFSSIIKYMQDYIPQGTLFAISTIHLLVAVSMLGIYAYVMYMFAKSYGKSQAFCVLSIFFSGITVLIMGFDRATYYVGPNGISQFGGFNNSYNGYNNYNNSYGYNGYYNGTDSTANTDNSMDTINTTDSNDNSDNFN